MLYNLKKNEEVPREIIEQNHVIRTFVILLDFEYFIQFMVFHIKIVFNLKEEEEKNRDS